jgi:L-histidine Nalpha-methyltransferase
MSRTRTNPSRRAAASRVSLHDLHPTVADLRTEVLHGLGLPAKTLSPKFFYDRKGSLLFDAITELPEYYPTRTEIAILRKHAEDMAALIGKGQTLIELGSGSSLKIQLLLTALQPAVYLPVDISRDHLLASAEALAERFPHLDIRAVCADYSGPFDLPLEPDWQSRAAFFPGSSIGNFEPSQAAALLRRIGTVLGPGGRLLIGVDLVKDQAVLEAAYNDDRGVTAAFNLNLLTRINRELKADFDLSAFRHRAWFNPDPDPCLRGGPGRIEMHLESLRDQQVQIDGHRIAFRAGETIHTENSYKFDLADFRALADDAGFDTEQVWTDPAHLFSVHGLKRR